MEVITETKECGYYDITEIGKLALLRQEELSDIYKYRPLPDDIALNVMRFYVATLPEGFHLLNNDKVDQNPEINAIIDKPGYEIIKEKKFPIVSRHGTMIANEFKRIVIGHYGAFIEIDGKDICADNVRIKTGQEYRVFNPRYSTKVKYYWYTTRDESDCKLYQQRRTVSYADYKVSLWYVSPFEVLDYNELLSMAKI